MLGILNERRQQVIRTGAEHAPIACSTRSAAGSVSQRACVFCGSRVVLYPVADALHLVHGPVGCAAYTWDIRGALSSGPQLHRNSFSTDLQEQDVIRGGEAKLYACLTELIARYRPAAAFVYSTCIVGVIGDDVEAVCRRVAREQCIPVIPVHSEGFKGTKKDGYAAACEALLALVGTGSTNGIHPHGVNLLGEFNVAGETWIIKKYLDQMGVQVVASMTGDGTVEAIRRAHGARLNVVQCSGSMMPLAQRMEALYGIPFIRVSYFGIEDMSAALYAIADFFGDDGMRARTAALVRDELSRVLPALREFKQRLAGRRAALYVGGAFKAFSLVRALRSLGMRTVLAGTQTGRAEDYRQLQEICDTGTVIVDDSNPLELAHFLKEQDVDLFIGGVKERPIAYKLGIGFCDHNHERKIPLAGFEGMFHFAREVHATVTSPVWNAVKGRPVACAELPGPHAAACLAAFTARAEAVTPAWHSPLSRAADGSPGPPGAPVTAGARNTCKLCAPLGASLAFRGVAGAIPFIHGSQGCATYIRRYCISHFREPFDIASSSLTEHDTVFGGTHNFFTGLDNVRAKYAPAMIGIATTCLSETIGENVTGMLRAYRAQRAGETLPALVFVSTPSYAATHEEGFHAATSAIVAALAVERASACPPGKIVLFPGLLSPADLRHLRHTAAMCGADALLVPDYSDTLDAPLAEAYVPIPPGGTSIEAIRTLASCAAAVHVGRSATAGTSAAAVLHERFGIPVHVLDVPVGLRACDAFVRTLQAVTGQPAHPGLENARGRLRDAMVDAHKYTYGLKAAVAGDADTVVGVCSFLAELGAVPVLCATGSTSGRLAAWLEQAAPGISSTARIIEGADFAAVAHAAHNTAPDVIIGASKAYPVARECGIPLIRTGFPIHDRFGAARLMITGYEGSMQLLDRLVNAVLEQRQERSETGYSYL